MISRTQDFRLIQVATPLGDDTLLLRSIEGREELGRLFEYNLDLLSQQPSIDVSRVLGQNVTVSIATPHGQTRYINGFVSQFADAGVYGRYRRFRATVVPWLWFLSRTSDCRIFQDLTVPDILKQVFRDHGFSDFDVRLSGNYTEREYCVQYRETCLNFVTRLMEQEGIYYHFEHENGLHKLVLCDHASAHQAYPGYETIPFLAPGGRRAHNNENITDWMVHHQVQPGKYVLNDFDFMCPKKQLEVRNQVDRQHAQSHGEIYDYPGQYNKVGDGEDLVSARLEELQSQYQVVDASSDAWGVACGYSFQMVDHPEDDHNKEYLITATHCRIDAGDFDSGSVGGDVWHCSFNAIDANQRYRPARVTAKPIVQGPQTAIVSGPAGEEIWTDQHGRVRVQFHWDRYGQADEKSSCWIRVAQLWAGKKWGAQFLPRIGHEVIVEFLEGDPDRPIITGSVYNGDNKPAYALPGNKHLSGIKTSSTKGNGGFNELRFDDAKGEEQLFIHAQRNLDTRVRHNAFHTVENNLHEVTRAHRYQHVCGQTHDRLDGDHHETMGKSRYSIIKEDACTNVNGNHALQVDMNMDEVIKMNRSEEVTGNRTLKAGMLHLEALGQIALKVGASSIVIDPSGVTISGPMVTIDGCMTRINSGPGSKPVINPSPACLTLTDEAGRAHEADKADPGEVAETKKKQKNNGTGKYGQTPAKPHIPPKPAAGGEDPPHCDDDHDPDKRSWIEIELIDDEGQPVPYEPYEVTLPDGQTVASGQLDRDGFARVDGIDPGSCQITFPNRDRRAWDRS